MGLKKSEQSEQSAGVEQTDVVETPDQPSTPTPAAPDPWAVMNRVAVALEALALRQGPAPNDHVQTLIETLSGAMARMSDNQLKGAELVAYETRRAHRPSNEVPPLCSVFNRRGVLLPEDALGPRKPKLKCLMMIPWLVEWESCTREEVELLNLLEAGEYTLKRIDNTKLRVNVHIDYKVDNKTPSRLLLNHDTAFNNDNKNLIPSLVEMLRQILRQHPASVSSASRQVMTDEEEEALIEAGELSVSV